MFIPLGKHTIKIIEMDEKKKYILTNETGIVKYWNHKLIIKKIGNKKTRYTDEVEIKSGILTWFFWLFASFYYRYRHWRWKKLEKNINKQEI